MAEASKGAVELPGPEDHQVGMTYKAWKDLIMYFYSNHYNHITDPDECLMILQAAGFYSLSTEFGSNHSTLLDHCERIVHKDKASTGGKKKSEAKCSVM